MKLTGRCPECDVFDTLMIGEGLVVPNLRSLQWIPNIQTRAW